MCYPGDAALDLIDVTHANRDQLHAERRCHGLDRGKPGRLVRKLRVGSGMSWLVRQPKSTNSGTENVKSKRIFAPRIISDHIMVQEDFERLHKFLLETEGLSEVSDEMRELVEEEWPELVHKLPPKVSTTRR